MARRSPLAVDRRDRVHQRSEGPVFLRFFARMTLRCGMPLTPGLSGPPCRLKVFLCEVQLRPSQHDIETDAMKLTPMQQIRDKVSCDVYPVSS